MRLLNWLGGVAAQIIPGGDNYNSYMKKKREQEQQRAPVPRPQPVRPQQQPGMNPMAVRQPQNAQQQGIQRQLKNSFDLIPNKPQEQPRNIGSAADVSRNSVANTAKPVVQQTPPPQTPRPQNSLVPSMDKLVPNPNQQRPQANQMQKPPRLQPQTPRPAAPRPQAGKPSFGEYLNPFGEHGLFGEKQQRQFGRVVKPITNKLENVQKAIDSSDDKDGFQWNSAGDYGRFAAKLLPGMAQGVLEAPEKVAAGISGLRINDQGAREDINGIQRAGSFADGAISVAGLPFGGSGVLLKSAVAPIAKATTSQILNGTGKQAAINLAKSAAQEGIEETVQTFAGDLADDGKVNTKLSDYAQAGALGALGGGMMHGAGKGIDYIKSDPVHRGLVKSDPEYRVIAQTAETTTNDLERNLMEQKMDSKIAQRKRVLEGGFIAGPNATGFNEAQAAGRVFTDTPDSKPRFEVSDENMRLRDGVDPYRADRLGDIVDHPELYKEYPGIENTPVKVGNIGGANASFDSRDGSITLSNALVDSRLSPIDTSNITREQLYDYYAKNGYTPNEIKTELDNVPVKNIIPQLSDEDLANITNTHAIDRTTTNRLQPEAANKLLHEVQHNIQDIEGFQNGTSPGRVGSMEGYRNDYGEAEARAVEARRTMTDAERYVDGKNTFDDSLDVPKEDLIVRNDSTDIAMALDSVPQQVREMGRQIIDRLKPYIGKAERKSVRMKGVSPLAIKAARQANVDISNWSHEITSNGLQHSLKNHGKNGSKLRSYDLPVTRQELELIPDILTNPDNVSLSPRKTKQGMFAFVYEKQYQGRVYYVEAINKESGTLQTQVMYVNKPSGANQLSLPNDHVQNVSQGDTGSIVKNGDTVNTHTEPALSPEDSQYIRETAAQYSDPKKYVRDLVEGIWERNKLGKGVDTALIPDDVGYGFSKRVAMSNNSPFYQEFYRENGKKPTKRAIQEMVQKEIAGEPTLLSKHQEISPFEAHIYAQIEDNAANVSRATSSEVPREMMVYRDEPSTSAKADYQPTKGQHQKQATRSNRQRQGIHPKEAKTDTLHQPSSSDHLQSGKSNSLSHQKSATAQTRRRTAYRTAGTPAQTGHTSARSISDAEAKAYVDSMGKAQDTARKTGELTTKEKAKALKADFKEKFIDNLAPIEDRLNKAIKDGAKVDTKDHITYQLDRSRRSEGIAQAFIRDNELDKIISEVPNTKEFDQYLIAKHAAELDPEIRTGRDRQMDASLVKKLDGKYKDYAKRIYTYNQKLLDTSVEYGLISKETARSLKKQYPEYVPFNRIFNEDELAKISGNGSGEASISKQTAVQKLKGSKRVIESPLESILDKTRVVVEQGERNKAAQMLASYRQLPGNPFNLKEIPANETIGTRHTISYLDKGVKRTFETDKMIADAAKNMTRQEIGLWGRIAAVPARALRAGATGVNVGFAGANVVKDVVGSAINSRHPFRIADPEAMGKALSAALNHKGEAYLELMREGVAGQSFDMYRNANKMNVDEVRSHKNLATRAKYVATTPSQWYRTIENTIGRSEDFGRALQYYSNKGGFEKKYGKGEKATILAADQARSNATNFFRYGSVGKNVNLAIPYWNATTQGTRINYNRIKERPVQTVANIGLAIAAPSAMIAMNNYYDEDKRKVMDNIPDYEKEGNIIIVGEDAKFNEDTGRWDGVWKWPMPPQHLGIHNTIQRAVEAAAGGREFDIVDAIGKIGENYTTVNFTDPVKTASTYTPQGLKVVAEPMTNTNFYSGDKIVPESMKNLDKDKQATKSTSLTAKALGKVTGQSPMVVDNSIRTAFGGAGQNALLATDWALAKAGAGSDEDVKGRDLWQSVKDRFVGAKGTSDGQLYFQTLDEASKKNKLAGKDLAIFNSLVNTKMNSEGDIEGANERDALNKYQNLAANPRVAKTISDAAKLRAEKTDEELDPLYKLDHEKQMAFYNIKSQVKKSIEQEDLIDKAGDWYKDLSKARSEFYKKQDIKPSENSQRVKYPKPSEVLQAKLDAYYAMPDGEAKYAYLDANPDINEQFSKVAQYNNEVRKAQGVSELHDYPQASERVQALMAQKNWKDPEVAQYLQDINVYKLIEGASQSRIKGKELDSKTLKAIQSTGRYSIIKNEDGTYSLKYNSANGYGKGAGGGSSGSGSGRGRGGRKGGRGSRGGSGGSKDDGGKSLVSTTSEVNKKLAKGIKTDTGTKLSQSKKVTMKKTPLKKYSVKKSGGAPKISSSKKKSNKVA